MASSRFFAFLLLISSQMFVGFSQDLSEFLKGTESILDGKLPPCMRQMLTCQPYIKSPENPPPACCTPLKELLDSDLPCLCSFFNNEKMLKTLNVSQSRALELPKNCGAELDISGCSDAESPTGSTEGPSSSTTPLTPTANTSGLNDSSTGGATRNNPTYGFGHGVAAASSVVALLLSAF
ncbi:protein YLS3-like [Cucurbita pepo subsp. pepo]|uniref:protein YLS3-like n=1 Tax=Cucurbita pepo subsp. pepo TaxID=3664 RepID=UPI000C9D8E1F|nr:protein YLS3-like [Cucurbita pepo subsp. pepo]